MVLGIKSCLEHLDCTDLPKALNPGTSPKIDHWKKLFNFLILIVTLVI